MCGMRILFLFLGYRCVYLVSKHDEQQDRINRNIHILKPIVNMETGSISVSISRRISVPDSAATRTSDQTWMASMDQETSFLLVISSGSHSRRSKSTWMAGRPARKRIRGIMVSHMRPSTGCT